MCLWLVWWHSVGWSYHIGVRLHIPSSHNNSQTNEKQKPEKEARKKSDSEKKGEKKKHVFCIVICVCLRTVARVWISMFLNTNVFSQLDFYFGESEVDRTKRQIIKQYRNILEIHAVNFRCLSRVYCVWLLREVEKKINEIKEKTNLTQHDLFEIFRVRFRINFFFLFTFPWVGSFTRSVYLLCVSFWVMREREYCTEILANLVNECVQKERQIWSLWQMSLDFHLNKRNKSFVSICRWRSVVY